MIRVFSISLYKPQRGKTYLLAREPQRRVKSACTSAQSDQSLSYRHFVSFAVQNAPSEESDQPAQMRRLIRIFAGRTIQMYVFWRCGSYKPVSLPLYNIVTLYLCCGSFHVGLLNCLNVFKRLDIKLPVRDTETWNHFTWKSFIII